jgi:hypothetical protein
VPGHCLPSSCELQTFVPAFRPLTCLRLKFIYHMSLFPCLHVSVSPSLCLSVLLSVCLSSFSLPQRRSWLGSIIPNRQVCVGVRMDMLAAGNSLQQRLNFVMEASGVSCCGGAEQT